MAEGIAISVATKVVEASVDKATKEAHYLCCFQSYVDDFDDKRANLEAKLESLKLEIEEARNRNANRVDPVVQKWLNEAKDLTQEDTKKKHKWFFGLCTNCIKKNRRAKDLEEKAQKIEGLLNNSTFSQVARLAGSPGLKFYHLQDFIHFESRKLKHEELQEALKNEDYCMIGLYGMGGMGKTTMVIQVGEMLEESKVFDKVIFTTASNSNRPADVIAIRADIAHKLDLPLRGEKDSDQAEELWTRIANNEGKLLIILDDVWDKELSLQAIGIPLGHQQKGHCVVLLTTRDLGVCRQMRCQKMIQLDALSPDDALNLFLRHSGKIGEDSSSNFQNVASEIVEECGRLPIAIVPVARSLNSKSLEYWKATLTRLQTFDPMSEDENEDLTKAYKSLRLSFGNLNNDKAQNLLFLCSMFPEDYEIPIELLRRISLGLGLCGEVKTYHIARGRFLELQEKLVESSLMLKVNQGHAKLHDLVRDMAIKLSNTKIQVVMDSNTALKEDIQYSFWNIGSFPNHFGGNKLEFLLVWINEKEDHVEVPESFFAALKELKVLVLSSRNLVPLRQLSLPKSIESLRNIRTLILSGWTLLVDMSLLGNLLCLETLELTDCTIEEVPTEISKLQKLILLGLKRCIIFRNNPFKVIERCQKLEELYFVHNYYKLGGENIDEQDHIEVPRALQRYSIICPRLSLKRVFRMRGSYNKEENDSISGCFKTKNLNIFSEASFKFLVANAEILELGEYKGTGWRNVVPDIVGMEDRGGMKDLIKLDLYSLSEIECLIHSEHLQPGVTIFSKIVELELRDLPNMREICYGPLPNDFLKQLETLNFSGCLKLEGMLFKDELELGKLKSIKLYNCSMTSLFYPSTAQSLKQLEALEIDECNQLKYIVMGEGSQDDKIEDSDPNQNRHDSMIQDKGFVFEMGKEDFLPSLKMLTISGVPSFINMFPDLYHSGASVTQNASPTTKDDGLTRKDPSQAFSWASICCFWPKSSATSTSNPSVSDSQASKTERISETIQCLLRQPLNPHNMKEMKITHCSKLTSLFTLTIASSMVFLEKLRVSECQELKHIVIDEGDGHDRRNCNSTFPNLQKVSVKNCSLLEDLFPACHFRTLDHLKSLKISSTQNLRHVFGKCYCEDNLPHQNQNVEIHLPVLQVLKLVNAPKVVSICAENCCLSTTFTPETLVFEDCPELTMRPFSGSIVRSNEIEDLTVTKANKIQPEKLVDLYLENVKIEMIYNLKGPMKSSLKEMRLYHLLELRHICVGNKNVLRLQNLSRITVQGCNKLKVIFSVSILKSLPQLRKLLIYECQELVQIVEETELNRDLLHQQCFPKLSEIDVRWCKSLRCLFSISIWGALPNLEELKIEDDPELLHVFGSKQGETKELVMKDLFPQLLSVQLKNLPSLVSVCQGIDFQMDPDYEVCDCPKLSLTSSTTTDNDHQEQDQKNVELECKENPAQDSNFQIQDDLKAQESSSQIAMPLSKSEVDMEVTKPVVEEELEIQEQKNSPSNLLRDALVDEGCKYESTTMGQQAPAKTIHDMHSNDSQNNIEVHVGEGSSLEKDNQPKSEVEIEVKKPIVEEESSIQEQKNSLSNLKIKVSIGESPSTKKEKEPNSSTNSDLEITHPSLSAFTEETMKARVQNDGPKMKDTTTANQNMDSKNTEVHDGEGSSSEKYNKATSTTHSEPGIMQGLSTSTKNVKVVKKLAVEKELANQEQNNSPQNLDIVEASVQDSPKLNESRQEPVDIPSQNESTQDTLIDEESKNESTSKGQQAAADSTPDNSNDSQNNIAVRVEKDPSLEQDNKKVSSTHPEIEITHSGPSTSIEELHAKKSMDDREVLGEGTTSKEAAGRVDKPLNKVQKGEIMADQINMDQKNKADTEILQQFEVDHDLIRLFQLMEEGAYIGIHTHVVSKIAADDEDDTKVAQAFADVEATLKMNLNEIANSEENFILLQNALNFMSTHNFEDGTPSHGLRPKIDSLHKKIQIVVSSFKQASTTIRSFAELRGKEKCMMNEELPQRKEAAMTLVSKIDDTKRSLGEAKKKEAKLKDQMSKLQAELNNNEQEIKDYEITLLSLKEQENKSFWDNMEFMKELEDVKNDRSEIEEDQIKARHELEKSKAEWSSCVADLMKATSMLGFFLKRKI